MKYVNRIRFGKIYSQWEILKMRAAYIAAEQHIIQEAANGNDITGHDSGMTVDDHPDLRIPQDDRFAGWEVDAFGNMKGIFESELLYKRGQEVRAKLDRALDEENYIKARMLQTVLDGIKKRYEQAKKRENGEQQAI